MRALAVLTLAAATGLGGCAAIVPPVAPPLADAPLPPVQPMARKGQSGGLFNPQSAWVLTNDSRAFRSGDVLTVILAETTQASKRSGTSLDKRSSASVQPLSIAGKVLDTSVGLSADREFSGGSSSTQQNALEGAITVVVHEVMANGLLRVSGEKSLWLNQGEEFIRLSGFVRAEDIDATNRVSSQRIANARIAYSGTGTLADANSPGWLTRFFTSPWMPF
jgi:flagellar L-ring protein precursor FlgH